jgi:O-glycosyl hydrolase
MVALAGAQPLWAATVTVNVGTKYQTVAGFGTCTSSGDPVWNPANWSTTTTNNLGYIYAKDLGLTILRMYIEPNTLLSPTVPSLSTVVTFTGNAATDAAKINLDQSRTRYQDEAASWLRDNALEPTAFKLIGSVWSPPHWMKEATGSTVTDYAGQTQATPFIGNYGNDTIGGQINLSQTTQFAYFCSAYIQAIKNRTGQDMYGFSIQNESTFENPFNSCTYLANGDFSRYAPTLAAVRNDFNRYGWGTQLMGPHVAGLGDTPGNPYALWQQNRFIQSIKSYADTTVINSLPIYTHHDYVLNPIKGAVMQKAHLDGKASVPGEAWASWVSNADVPGVRADGKQHWMSEVSGEANSLDGALILAQRLHDHFVWGSGNAYIYWQLADGGANATESTLIGSNNLSNPTGSKKYSAFKHFTRYIRPGATRVQTSPSAFGGTNEMDTSNSVDVSAFHHPTNKTLTIVVVNRKSTQQSLTLNLTGTSIVNNRFNVWRTSSSQSFASLAAAGVTNNQVSMKLPAKCVTTFVASTL